VSQAWECAWVIGIVGTHSPCLPPTPASELPLYPLPLAGTTPLMMACVHAHVLLVCCLVRRGARMDQQVRPY
jgi:hypothetical protein